MNKLLLLKDVIERRNVKRNIVFICADFLNIPIQNYSIDIVIDQSGTSNYSFEHEEFLLCELNSLFKHNSYLLSSFILFNKFSINSQIAPRLRVNFTSVKVTKEIQNLQFQSIDESTSNYLIRGESTRISLFKEKKFIHIHFSEKDGVNPVIKSPFYNGTIYDDSYLYFLR